MSSIAFQDLIPDNHCFGCGPENEGGLRIKSFWDGDESVCRFRPLPAHAAGPRQFLNGGIAATLIDCHSVCTAVAWAYRAEEREIGSAPEIWCVTGSLQVEYLSPVPIGEAVSLRARVLERKGKKTALECALSSEDTECARGKVIAIRVPEAWRAGHTRGL